MIAAYVQDCIGAMSLAVEKAEQGKANIFNLGTDEYCRVDDSIRWICEHMGVAPQIVYAGGERGWIADNPFIFLDCSRTQGLGWRPKLSIREGVTRTLQYFEQNRWVLEWR